MRTPLALLALGLALIFGQKTFAQDATVEEAGKSPVEAKFAPGGRLRMDLCPGGIELIGRNDSLLRVSYYPERDNVRVRIQSSAERADIRLSGCPHGSFKVTIEVPKSSDLYVRMLAGDLGVKGITGDKDVELHFGHLTMDIGQPADIASVEASVNSGDLEVSPFDVSKGGLFRSFDKTGPGKYRIRAHVGAGQLELR